MIIGIVSLRYPYHDNMVHVFVKKLVDQWANMGHQCIVVSPINWSMSCLKVKKLEPYYERQEISADKYVEVYRPRVVSLPNINILGVNIKKCVRNKVVQSTIERIGIPFDFLYAHFFDAAFDAWSVSSSKNIPLFLATGESVLSVPGFPNRDFSIEKFRQKVCGVVAVSSKNKAEAVSVGLAEESKVQVFPNGANLSLFRKMDKIQCREKLNLPVDVFIVICVGQFIERKGQRRILQALDKLGNDKIKTIFVGKGVDDFQHPSILYKGTLMNTELPYYLNAADLFVLPTRKEGCCNAIIEALACGLPIVSSNLPFNYDVLDESNSILVDPDNIDQIASAIDSLYQSSTLLESLSAGSYKKGQQLAIEVRATNIISFITERLNERK